VEKASEPTARRSSTVQRLVRNTVCAVRAKEWHEHRCQICGVQLQTPGGPYAEGAHIRALGRPHDGPDVESDLLCLCPNGVDAASLAYHRTLFRKE